MSYISYFQNYRGLSMYVFTEIDKPIAWFNTEKQAKEYQEIFNKKGHTLKSYQSIDEVKLRSSCIFYTSKYQDSYNQYDFIVNMNTLMDEWRNEWYPPYKTGIMISIYYYILSNPEHMISNDDYRVVVYENMEKLIEEIKKLNMQQPDVIDMLKSIRPHLEFLAQRYNKKLFII